MGTTARRTLSKRTVEAVLPGSGGARPDGRLRDVHVWDAKLPGFVLRVTPNGARVYWLQYRMRGLGRAGTPKWYRIGSHGALTADQARDLARQALARVEQGEDPALERQRRKDAPTVRDLGALFLEDVDAHRKARTAAEYRRLWDKHVLPALGTRKTEDVQGGDVRKVHRSLRATPYLANRVLALLGSTFAFAEGEGLRAKHTNPARDVTPFPEHARERFLTPDEVRRLGDVLRVAEREGLPPAPKRKRTRVTAATLKHYTPPVIAPANPYAIAALRFLLLTGCRESEALTLRWDAVDLERGFLRLADTKTGASTRPLSASAAALLGELPRVEGSPYVFPGRGDVAPLRDVSRLWDAVRHAAKLEDVRLHDLRHTHGSTSALGGDSLLVIGKLLGHRNARTTSRYAHLSDDPVKAAADRTGGTLAAWLEGKDTPVIALRSNRSA